MVAQKVVVFVVVPVVPVEPVVPAEVVHLKEKSAVNASTCLEKSVSANGRDYE